MKAAQEVTDRVHMDGYSRNQIVEGTLVKEACSARPVLLI